MCGREKGVTQAMKCVTGAACVHGVRIPASGSRVSLLSKARIESGSGQCTLHESPRELERVGPDTR